MAEAAAGAAKPRTVTAAGEGRGGAKEAARQLAGFRGQGQRPASLQRPQVRTVSTQGRRIVYFDLETTGLELTSHITQIGACSGENTTFSSFVLPKIPISEEAQNITGIKCTGQQMYQHGKEVPCLSITQALEDFIKFLRSLGDPVVISGHYIKLFDCPILLRALQACGLVERFQEAVHGFVDTYPLLKKINHDVENHQLITLFQYYTGEEFMAHDAVEDARAVQRIMIEANPRQDLLSRHTFTLDYIIHLQRYNAAMAL